MDGIVPAAGRGTRLRPRTSDTPKALVAVDGRPLIEYPFDGLIAAGVDRFVVVVGDRGDAIVDRCGDHYRGVPVAYIIQDDPLGVADALQCAGEAATAPALVCHGDLVFAASLSRVRERHEATGAAVTLSVDQVDHETARETGVCVFEDDRLVGLVEKPDDPPSRTAIVGAYAVGEAFFAACERIEPSDRGEYELPDVVSALLEDGHHIETVPVDGWWENVNDESDLDRTSCRLDESGFPT